jgi:hypothetical protein
MRYIILIFTLLISLVASSQQRFPSGFPTQLNTGWNRWGYAMSDSGLIVANRDTNWLAKFSGTVVFKPSNKKFYWFDSTNLTWNLFGSTIDTTSLSNRINLKLNISDTAAMLLPYLRKADTTNKWVQDVYVRNDSLFKFKNGAETFLDTLGGGGGGSGTVTSVALSVPSAFTVSGSPITTSGTFNISGAGTTAQYIRGNGTLATTDTGMIPNFHLKVRSLFSGTSPITFNTTTGAIGISNANTSGTKGAATFNNSNFSDNGSGLISLSTLVSAGSCTGCVLNIGTDGRITGYSDGAGGATNNVNIGAGFRPVNAITQEMRTYFAGFGNRLDTVANTDGITWSADTTRVTGLPTYYYIDSLGSENISNTSLTANGDYSQNWNNKQWYVDSIAGSLLFRTGGIGSSGTRRKGFRINWGGNSFGDNLDGYNIMAYVNKADNSGDSLQLGMISSGLGTLSLGVYDATLSNRNTFISYSSAGLINISARDSIWIKGAIPAATADSIIGLQFRSPGVSKVVKIPFSGSGGATLNNLGSGFRWVATSSGDIKTAFGSNTITIDSASNSNALTFKADTSILATQYDLTQIGSGVTSFGLIGNTPNANGASVSGATATLQPTNGVYGGVVTVDTQTIAGAKALISQHNTIDGYSARLNSQWFPSEKIPDTIANGKYQAFGITDIFPSGTIVTVYSEGDNHVLDNGVVKMKKSTDNGRTWATTTIINNTPGVSIPAMGAGGVTHTGRLVLFYVRFFGSTFQSLNIIYSDDEGATFSSPVTIPVTPYVSNILPYGPLVKIGSDSLLLSFYGQNGDTSGVKVIKSGDDGVTWGSPITVVEDTIHSYTESSFAYLGGNTIIGLSRNEVNPGGRYRQSLSTDNGNTWSFQGHVTWGIDGTPAWLRTYTGVNGRKVAVAYYRSGTLGNYEIRYIHGYAKDLIVDSSGWDLNSEKTIAVDVNGSGYANVVHPYENPYGFGWYYDEIVPQADATMKFFVVPINTEIPIKQSFASDVTFSDLAGNGSGVMGIDNNGKASFVAGGSGFQWIQSGSDVYRLNNVGIGGAPVSGNDLHINKSTSSRFTITSGTASGHLADIILTEDNSFGAGTYANILRYTNASSNNGMLNINNLGKEISLSTQFGGGFIKNISIKSTGEVGIQNTATTGADLHVNKSSGLFAGSASVYVTSANTGNSGALFVIGEDASAAPNTYAQYGRFALTALPGLLPGDLFFHNDGDTITFTTLYSGGFRKDLQVLPAGKIRFSNAYQFPNTIGSSGQSLRVPVSGDELEWYTPSSATTLYSGNGSLAGDRNVSSAGFTLRIDGANNSDTLLSVTNTGTSSTGLYSIGSLFGVDAQSANVGLRAFGTVTGLLATGDGSEGAVIKSNAIRGATIQSVPSSTNTVVEVLRIERGSSGGAGGNGIGGRIDFYNKASDNSSNMSNQFISSFTNATVGSRTSTLSVTGVDNASTNTILTIEGDGSLTTIGKRTIGVATSSAGTLTLGNSEAYVFNGTTTTWTLPAVSGTTGRIYYLKNIGSGTITLNADSGNNEIYSTSAVNTYAVTAGSAIIAISNGTYWTIN